MVLNFLIEYWVIILKNIKKRQLSRIKNIRI